LALQYFLDEIHCVPVVATSRMGGGKLEHRRRRPGSDLQQPPEGDHRAQGITRGKLETPKQIEGTLVLRADPARILRRAEGLLNLPPLEHHLCERHMRL